MYPWAPTQVRFSMVSPVSAPLKKILSLIKRVTFMQGRQGSTERLITFHSRPFSRHEELNCSLDLQH